MINDRGRLYLFGFIIINVNLFYKLKNHSKKQKDKKISIKSR